MTAITPTPAGVTGRAQGDVAGRRYTRAHPCPICQGHESMPRGQGVRCDGYLFGDGAYCARDANGKRHPSADLYWHRLRDSKPQRAARGASAFRIVATYDYTDEAGTLLYQVVRLEPKDFRQRRPDGAGGWTWKLEGVKPVLYRLPELLAAVAAEDPVYVAEGEKDADALHRAGCVATCNSGGAGKWRPHLAEHLRGVSDVRIIADRDEPGYRHAGQVAASLRSVGAGVRVFEGAQGKDVSDHLGAGRSLEELVEIDLEERLRGAAGVHEEPAPAAEAKAPPLTDLGNAERLVRLHGEDLRYVHTWGRWLAWDGRRFADDTSGEIHRRAKTTVRAMYAEAADLDDAPRKALAGWARRSESAGRIDAMIALARSEVPVDHEALDRDAMILTVANGTLDLHTGALREHRRADLATKLAPVAYSPDAAAPTWVAFLERILPDADVREFVRRAVGYSLTGETGEQVLFLCWGSGANGKTTFVETVMAMLGDFALKTPAETLLAKRDNTIPNDVAALRGARFVAAVESEEGRRLAEVRIKELTGSDTISARFMRAEWFTFKPVAKLWLATNHRPVVRGTDEAIWRRIRLIPFNVTIPELERDPTLPARLRAELPGVLRWAVGGCLAWHLEGLGAPAAVLAATRSYRAEQDVLGAFLAERCLLAPTCWVSSASLYAAYRQWCEASGEHVVTQRALGLALRERGFEDVREGKARSRGWQGIGLLDRPEGGHMADATT